MTIGDPLLLTHAAATLALTGLIWFVQLVHYPLFHRVAPHSFDEFAREHQRRTAWIVVPLMTTEACSAALLVTRAPDPLTAVGAGLVVLIWLSTALLQVPCHRRLAVGFEPTAVRQLVAGNWLRTAAWTARSAVALRLLVTASGN